MMRTRNLPYLLLAFFAFFFPCNLTALADEKKAYTEQIEGNHGIATLEKVMIGGSEQWITVRGENKENPILLYLHGGPGHAEMSSNPRFKQLEKRFVVVNWDQRGSGKSFSPHLKKESIHVEQFLADTHEMVETLKKRFGREKIYLVGHSWGSLLGMIEVKRNPQSFYAYIGIGQFVDVTRGDKIGYEFTLKKAKELGNMQAIQELQRIGSPPYQSLATFMQFRKWLIQLGGIFYSPTFIQDIMIPDIHNATEYTDEEKMNYEKGEELLTTVLLPELSNYNLLEIIDQVEIPVFFVTGKYDYNTPYKLIEEFHTKLEAPYKELIWFDKSGHAPNYEEEQKFAEVMNEYILPRTISTSCKK